jgi:xanthine/uracil permease
MARKRFSLYQYKQRAVETLKKSSNVCSFGVLACTAYSTLWQRDVNASNNAMTIAHSIWRGEGYSDCFQKSKTITQSQ